MKKIIVLFAICAIFISFAPSGAMAYTTSELSAKIDSLQKQFMDFQSRLSVIESKIDTYTAPANKAVATSPNPATSKVVPVAPTNKSWVITYYYDNKSCVVRFDGGGSYLGNIVTVTTNTGVSYACKLQDNGVNYQ